MTIVLLFIRIIVTVVTTGKTNVMTEEQMMSKQVLNMRADNPWLLALDDLAVKLRLGNRSRVVDVAVDILSDLAEVKMPPRCLHPVEAVVERFSAEDKARLLRNAQNVIITK